MITIGIDPGLTGAIGFLSDGVFVAVEDMPTQSKGTGSVKREVDGKQLIALLRRHSQPDDGTHVMLERVNAMPGQGVSSVFSLGDSYGSARAAIAACRFEVSYVVPAVWKKHFKLTRDKEMSRELAISLFPEAPLKLKKHSDRAEALLMARYIYEKHYK